MRRSEIFESFFKIAQEKGMISNDSEKSKKQLEKDPRADSLSISDIEALYGVKPNKPKEMEYENNIMETAHPNSLVISPSYDKLNGLVENNIERQNILLHIVEKTPNGLSTQHKYAEKDLILTLVRVGNDLDNQNKDELRKLADACLLQVHGKKKVQGKIALAFPVAAVAGVSAILGALYLQQHMSFADEGYEVNHQKLMAELKDMIDSSSSWGVGYSYTAELQTMLRDFESRLTKFHDLYSKVKPIIASLEMPKDKEQLLEIAKQPKTDNVINAYNILKKAAESMVPYLNTIEKNFASESFKGKQIQEKGLLTSLLDKTQFLHGGKGLIADDFDDVVRAIPPYKKSVSDMLKTLSEAKSFEDSANSQLQQAAAESEKDAAPAGEKSKEDIDNEATNLENDLTDLLGKGL